MGQTRHVAACLHKCQASCKHAAFWHGVVSRGHRHGAAQPYFQCPYGMVWFQGGTDMEQLNLIFSTLGVPNEAMWPGVSQLKTYVPFREKVSSAHTG
eukprot:1137748-Pelagomonas_calceolata.AAC.4